MPCRLFASNAAPTASHGKKYSYDWPRPALTVDTVLVTSESRPKVLLIQRDHEPNTGSWALSGGFVNENEPLETAAERELEEETSFPPSEVGKMVQVRSNDQLCFLSSYSTLHPNIFSYSDH